MKTIRTQQDLEDAIEYYGFLPFFSNNIPGFSIEEMCAPEAWFSGEEGAWEWKGPIARKKKCIYGKFFNKKAGFVSKKWVGDFINYRRDGYDYDARYNDGLVFYKDLEMYNTITEKKQIISINLKDRLNYHKGGQTGFETVINRLMMQGYVCIGDFTYKVDKHGEPYGWGIGIYTTPEELFGYSFIEKGYQRKPEESRDRIIKHLSSVLENSVDQRDINKLIKL